jgi:hypothetical protein
MPLCWPCCLFPAGPPACSPTPSLPSDNDPHYPSHCDRDDREVHAIACFLFVSPQANLDSGYSSEEDHREKERLSVLFNAFIMMQVRGQSCSLGVHSCGRSS